MASTTKTVWRARRRPTGSVESDLIDAVVSPALNRFASYATLYIRDTGTKRSNYSRGQRVEMEYSRDSGSTYTRRMAGFVNERTDGTHLGVPCLIVEVAGYDHLLRRRSVFDSYSAQPISAILQDIVESYTGVNWDASNVDIVNDETVTIEFDGQKVDECIEILVGFSADEEYGVNDDFEFFARERSVTRASVDILDKDVVGYDLPDEGKRAINQVRVFYGGVGSRASVIVEDRVDQRALKDALGAPRRIVFQETRTLPEVDNEASAAAYGREVLRNKTPLIQGVVETFGKEQISPGEVIRLTISDKDIDDDYRVAGITWRWVRGETTVEVVENIGDVTDLLVQMRSDIDRINLRDADPDASFTRFLDFTSGVTATAAGRADQTTSATSSFISGFGSIGDTAGFFNSPVVTPGFGVTNSVEIEASATVVTNTGVNMFRDTWQGASRTAITKLVVGDGSAEPSQTDTGLSGTELDEVACTVTEQSFDAIRLTGTITAGGPAAGSTIGEIAFLDASDNCYARAVFDPGVVHSDSQDTDFRITISLADDPELVGVVTNNGITSLRDLFTGNDTTATPVNMVWGTGTVAESPSQTALGNQVASVSPIIHADRGNGLTDNITRLGTGDVNNFDLSEIGLEDNLGQLQTRVVFEGLLKDSQFALEGNQQLKVRGVPT